jgi:hypothetical protein
MIFPALIVLLSAFQALADQLYVLLRRPDAGFGFLLEGVEDINDSSKADRINSTVSVAPMVFHNFNNARPFAFPEFGMRVGCAELGEPERVSHFRLNFFGKRLIVLFCRSKPVERFFIHYRKEYPAHGKIYQNWNINSRVHSSAVRIGFAISIRLLINDQAT